MGQLRRNLLEVRQITRQQLEIAQTTRLGLSCKSTLPIPFGFPTMPPKVRNAQPTNTNVRLLDLMLRVAIAVMAFVAGAWGSLGRIVAEKLVTALAMPTGVIWLLLLVAVLAARRARRFDLMLAIAIPWTALTLLGNSLVVDTLARSLEQPFRSIRPLQSEPMDAVVVLGGGTLTGGNGRTQGNTSGDRIILAAQLFHAKIAPRIICTGRRIDELSPDRKDPAEESQAILMSLGVPKGSIQLLDGRNTSEEMKSLGQMFGHGESQVGLVTSAWHLPRALRLANRNGFSPTPLPADFISSFDGRKTTAKVVLDCIPQDGSLWTTSKLLKEYLGMLVGR